MEVFIGPGQLFSRGELSKSWSKDMRIKSAELRSMMGREQPSWYFVVEEISKANVEEQSYCCWLSPSLFLPLCKLAAPCSVLCPVHCALCSLLCALCSALYIVQMCIAHCALCSVLCPVQLHGALPCTLCILHLLGRLKTFQVALRCWLLAVQHLHHCRVSSRFSQLYFAHVFYCLLLPALCATCSWCNPASFPPWVFSSAHHILLSGWATVGDAKNALTVHYPTDIHCNRSKHLRCLSKCGGVQKKTTSSSWLVKEHQQIHYVEAT